MMLPTDYLLTLLLEPRYVPDDEPTNLPHTINMRVWDVELDGFCVQMEDPGEAPFVVLTSTSGEVVVVKRNQIALVVAKPIVEAPPAAANDNAPTPDDLAAMEAA